MNYIFISPNYPAGHWRYIAALRAAGHSVWGIGDAGDETFPAELRGNLNDYYRVGDLHDFDSVYRACCYFIGKYGRFDAVESLNPYWCDLCAALRADFLEIYYPEDKYMKELYGRAEQELVQRTFYVEPENLAEIAGELGYPVRLVNSINKRVAPRVLRSEAEAAALLSEEPDSSWYMRRVADGEPVSVDALFCRPTAGTENETVWNEVVTVLWSAHALGADGSVYCLSLPDDALSSIIAEMMTGIDGEDSAMVFCHADCVKLARAVRGMGKKGDIVLNDWSKTPPHEFIIDCMNVEFDCDVRAMWASGVMPETLPERKFCAGVACRSFERSYKNPHEKIMRRLGGKLRLHGRTHPFDVCGYLDYHYIFCGADSAELRRTIKYITEDYAVPELPKAEPVKGSAPAAQPAPAAADEGEVRFFAEAGELLDGGAEDEFAAEFAQLIMQAVAENAIAEMLAEENNAGGADSAESTEGTDCAESSEDAE